METVFGDLVVTVALLADRKGPRVADRVRALDPQVRDAFRSFGTCSIVEPVAELSGLGLLDSRGAKDLSPGPKS